MELNEEALEEFNPDCDFWYDLTDGGYIKPEEFCKDPKEAEKVREAIETLSLFRQSIYLNFEDY